MTTSEVRLPRLIHRSFLAKVVMAALLAISLIALLAGPAKAATPKFSFGLKNSEGGATQFSSPAGVGTDSAGNVYIANEGKSQVEKFSGSGKYLAKFGSASGAGHLSRPTDVDIDPSGNVWVAEGAAFSLTEFSSSGAFLRNVPTFEHPVSVATDAAGNVWALSEELAWEYSPAGKFMNVLGTAGLFGGVFHQAVSIDVDTSGQIWVSSDLSGTPTVYRFSSTGTPLSSWATTQYPAGISADGSGNVWVAFSGLCRVEKFSPVGALLDKFGECGAGVGKLGAMSRGSGLAVAPEGALWVSNSGVNEVQKWTP